MIYKNTNLLVMDKNNILKVKVIHIFKRKKKYASISCFLKVSIQIFNNYIFTKKKIYYSILCLIKKEIQKKDNLIIKFKINSIVILKNRLISLGKEIIGPILFNIKRKKFFYSFLGII